MLIEKNRMNASENQILVKKAARYMIEKIFVNLLKLFIEW